MAATLGVEKVNINALMRQECAKFTRREETTLHMVPPEEAVQEKEIGMVVYHTQAVGDSERYCHVPGTNNGKSNLYEQRMKVRYSGGKICYT